MDELQKHTNLSTPKATTLYTREKSTRAAFQPFFKRLPRTPAGLFAFLPPEINASLLFCLCISPPITHYPSHSRPSFVHTIRRLIYTRTYTYYITSRYKLVRNRESSLFLMAPSNRSSAVLKSTAEIRNNSNDKNYYVRNRVRMMKSFNRVQIRGFELTKLKFIQNSMRVRITQEIGYKRIK